MHVCYMMFLLRLHNKGLDISQPVLNRPVNVFLEEAKLNHLDDLPLDSFQNLRLLLP